MPYHLRLDDEAAATLAALPAPLRQHLARELQRLAADPGTLSRKVSFPHPMDGQLFDTQCTTAGIDHFFTVMFKYLREEYIVVAWIMLVKKPHGNAGG